MSGPLASETLLNSASVAGLLAAEASGTSIKDASLVGVSTDSADVRIRQVEAVGDDRFAGHQIQGLERGGSRSVRQGAGVDGRQTERTNLECAPQQLRWIDIIACDPVDHQKIFGRQEQLLRERIFGNIEGGIVRKCG